MVFAVISVLLFLIWRLSSKNRKLVSVSFAMFMGTLLFVGLGLELDPYEDVTLSVIIIAVFYTFLIIGERAAERARINVDGLRELGASLVKRPLVRNGFLLLFIVLSVLPLVRVMISGQSVPQLLIATWGSDTRERTSQLLIERSLHSLSGLNAVLNAVQTQMTGFWFLGLGIALMARRRLAYAVLAVYIFGTFLSGSSSRTIPMMAIMLPFMVIVLPPNRPKLRMYFVAAILGIGLFLASDSLLAGRQGATAQGPLFERVDRELKTDFAYGGLGLRVGLGAKPESLEQGINYLIRMAVLPIPRALWPNKPSTNPNQVFTELYFGRSLEEVGTILLFTPLGEALIVFGHVGVALVPFLYGFTAVLLERLYSTSEVYKGLLIQVYLWAFLGMRLTYFNLFSTLVAANFFSISFLVVGAMLMARRRRSRAVSHGGRTYRGTAEG